MKASPMSIILYGTDPVVLDTRLWALKAAGHQVWTATDLQEIALYIAHAKQLDMLILCHSLAPQECGRAVTLAHARWPDARVLVLAAKDTSAPAGVIKEVLRALKNPPKLGMKMERMVANESNVYSHLY